MAAQVVSSAIMNAPPPPGLISSLQACSTAKASLDRHTKEKMVSATHSTQRWLFPIRS